MPKQSAGELTQYKAMSHPHYIRSFDYGQDDQISFSGDVAFETLRRSNHLHCFWTDPGRLRAHTSENVCN